MVVIKKRFLDTGQTFQKSMVGIFMGLAELTLRVIEIVEHESPLVNNLISISFFCQTIVIKIGEIFGKLEYFC